MGAENFPKWPPRDRSRVISKEEYANLRTFANANGISLIGVKIFDGTAQVVRETLEVLVELKNKFPAVTEPRHKLELELSILLGAADYAETVRRTIKLNANAFRDVEILAREYQKDVDNGWFVKGTSWRDIVHHSGTSSPTFTKSTH